MTSKTCLMIGVMAVALAPANLPAHASSQPAAAAPPAGAQPVDAHAADKAAVIKAETDLANATNVVTAEKFYAPDAVVIDLIAPGFYRGSKEIHAGFAPQFDELKGIKVDMREMNVVTDGQLACAFSLQHAVLDLKKGAPMDVSLAVSDLWRKVGSQWLIEHQHLSYPADPKTGMSVMNAQFAAHDPIEWRTDPVPGPREPEAQAKSEIYKLIEGLASAQVIDDLMKGFGPTDDVSIYDWVNPGIYRGLAETRVGYGALMHFKSIKVDFKSYGIVTDGRLGSAYSLQHLVITGLDGKVTEFDARQSDCVHRVDGKWYAFHEHFSVPTDAKTGKAVMLEWAKN